MSAQMAALICYAAGSLCFLAGTVILIIEALK